MDTSGSTSRSIISCLGLEIFVQINRILTKFCHMKVEGSGNYDTLCIYILGSTLLLPNTISPGAKFTLHPNWQRYCTVLE